MYIPKSVNDLIENYFPNYCNSKEIHRLDVLTRYLDGELSEGDCVEYLISDEENYEKEFNELSEKIFSESLKAFVAKSKETDEVQYTLGEAVLWLIENGFEISSGNTGRIIRSGIDSDFEVAEYNELSGKPFNDIENAMEYANE
ncbi:hypothetical protein [Bacteroides sp. 224]|uniref:hypothetical protein n=1 Tax=Bacteroides sp. 224 TaxID=2302936 RepID=UPI0013D36495|nr:hypothetical protein [Bacteroides sp. 224]NDV64009.1 hypothetical protein [Bacteroides sp. 224]